MADDELGDVFERAGITDEDFGEEPQVAPEVPEAEPAPDEGRTRDEQGRFAAKTTDPEAPEAVIPTAEAPPEVQTQEPVLNDAPARFSPDAKAAWAEAHPAIRGEVQRAFGELEAGIEKYRQQIEPLQPLVQRAEANGQNPADIINQYMGIEDLLRTKPLEGLEAVCRNMGTDLKSVAAHVMGQPAPERDQEMEALKRQIESLTGNVSSFRQQQSEAMVAEFARTHPRLDELAPEIAQMLKTKYASSLEDAYAKAERLNPAPQPAPVAQAQTPPPANRSLSGAPSTSGSNPPARTQPKSVDDSVDWAFQSVGL